MLDFSECVIVIVIVTGPSTMSGVIVSGSASAQTAASALMLARAPSLLTRFRAEVK